MQERHTEQDYRALLIADTPIIDVRAPIEFEQGAMPAAINLPLMNNDERAAVGTCYKQQGSDAALALGHNWWRVKFVSSAWTPGGQRACKIRTVFSAAPEAVSAHILCKAGCMQRGLIIRW